MSYVLFGDGVIFFQRLLKSESLYKARVDGISGPETEKAATQFHEKSEKIMDRLGYFDKRTEGHIFSLTLKTQQLAREFMNRVLDAGFDVKIISGTRTYDEQNELFRKSRFGNPGKIVTKARGGRSNHNFGIAWDIGVFTARDGYSTDEDGYVEVAETGKTPDIEWGGDWMNFFAHRSIQNHWALVCNGTHAAKHQRGTAIGAVCSPILQKLERFSGSRIQ